MRAGEDGAQRRGYAGLEIIAFRGASVVERHETGEVTLGQRPAIGFRAEPLHDLACARALFARRGRTTAEDLTAARRLRNARRIERSADNEVVDMGQRRRAVGAVPIARLREVMRTDQIFE